MKRILLLTALLMTTYCARGQDCYSTLNDEAGMFKNPDAVTKAVRPLVEAGADAKVVTVSSIAKFAQLAHVDNPNLTAVEAYYESKCPSWRSPNGGRKANLFVIMIAPHEKQRNVFFGSSYVSDFVNSKEVDQIFSQASVPYFRAGQFADGIAATSKAFSKKIKGEEGDLGFLVTFAWLFFGTLIVFGATWFGYSLIQKRRREKQDTADARAKARDEWNRANTAYLNMPKDNPRYGDISQQFSDLSNRVGYDPNTDMTKSDYLAAADAWRDLRASISNATNQAKVGAPPAEAPEQAPHRKWKSIKHKSESRQSAPRTPPAPQPAPPQQPQQVVRETTVIHDGGNDMLTGMLIGEAMSSRREPDYEPERHRYREPDPEPTKWADDDSRGGSGSDQTWSSPDPSPDPDPPSSDSYSGGDGGSGNDRGDTRCG